MWDNFMTSPSFPNAACDTRNGYDPELWFPDSYDNDTREVMESAAIAICWTCEHREQCLQFALDENIRDGVWGGFTAQERKVMRIAGKANE